MLSETVLNRLIISWKADKGVEIKGRMCVPTDNGLRRDMYKHLIKTLVEEHGYTQEDFEGITFRRVIEASMNVNSDKKEGWKRAAIACWNEALNSFFPMEVLTHDSSTEPERKQSTRTYVPDDEPIELKNPIDESIYKDIPKVNHVPDEEFLEVLKGIGNE